jgi:hypothetical protein
LFGSWWRWFYPAVRPTNSYTTQLEQNIRADPVQTSSNQIELDLTGLLQPADRAWNRKRF